MPNRKNNSNYAIKANSGSIIAKNMYILNFRTKVKIEMKKYSTQKLNHSCCSRQLYQR